MCSASISELDVEQWEANTSVDTARGGGDNITPDGETVSESRPGAIPEMTVQMDGAKSTDKEIVRHFQRIAVSAQCPDAVRRSVQAPSSRQVVGESGLSTKRRGWTATTFNEAAEALIADRPRFLQRRDIMALLPHRYQKAHSTPR